MAAAAWGERVAVWSLVAGAAVSPLSHSLQDAAIVTATLGWLLAAVSRRQPPRAEVLGPFLLWIGAAALSCLNSGDLHASLHGLRKLLKVALIVLVAAEVFTSSARRRALLLAMLAGATFIAADGLVQVWRGRDVLYGALPGGAPGGLPRVTGPYGHANDLALYVTTILPVAASTALGVVGPRAAWWGRGLLAGLGTVLLLTFSRSGALAVTVSGAAFCVLRRAWKTLAVCAAGGLAGWLALPAPIREWAASHPSWLAALAQPLRFEIWDVTWRMIAAHPWIGVGVNTFLKAFPSYQVPGDPLAPAYAHNQYLHLTAELGLVGLAAFVWLLVRTAQIWRQIHREAPPADRLLATGLGCGLLAFLTMGLLESVLYSSRTYYFFWIWLGLLAGLRRTGSASHA